MPMKSKDPGKNISEFRGGKTFKATAAKFGAARAQKQAIAAGLNAARKAGGKSGGGPPMPTFKK